MAGLLATATMSLALDLLLYTLAAIGQAAPSAALVGLGQVMGERVGARPRLMLVGGIAVYAVLQMGWAIVYAHVERWCCRTPTGWEVCCSRSGRSRSRCSLCYRWLARG